MDQDPLEREKEFRRRVEGAARAAREARLRRTRPWLAWLKGLGNVLFKLPWLPLSLVFLIPAAVIFLLFFSLHIKWTEAYACSLSEARRHATVLAELGEPVEAGLFAWSPGYAREGAVTDTSFSTGLKGPRGKARSVCADTARPSGRRSSWSWRRRGGSTSCTAGRFRVAERGMRNAAEEVDGDDERPARLDDGRRRRRRKG